MKSYDETVKDVFLRMNEYEAVQKRKRRIISRTVTSLCCACMIAIIGIGSHNIITSPSWDNEQTESNHNNPSIVNSDQHNPSIVNSDQHNPGIVNSDQHNPGIVNPGQPANLPNNAGSVLPPKQVIRSYPCSEPERYVLPKNGEILITKPLYAATKEYGDSVVYEIEVYLLNNAESYLSNEAEWMQEYERISKITEDEQLGLSTYNDGNGQKCYMLLGVVSKDFIDNFPVSDQYGYYITLSGGTDECTAQDPNIDIYNGKASQK